jgi:predicted DNA-binding transcriptional regulator AlpA
MNSHQPDASERLIRLPEVLRIIPVSRSEWYRRLASGDAPAAVPLGPRARAWRLSDVHDYLVRIAARDRANVPGKMEPSH